MKTIRIAAFAAFLSIAFFSCSKEDVKAPDNTSTGTGTVTSTVNKDLLLKLVNDVRTSGCTCGTTTMPPVPTVTWNTLLEKAAIDYSKDMNAYNYFSHTGRDGSDPGQRITKAGYVWKAYGENIAKGYATEQAVMTGWLNSEGHCKNIMSNYFKEMGVGRDGNYWTQEFGAR